MPDLRFSDDLHRPQFQQHLKPVIDIPLVRCFEEWECCHVAQFQCCHAQDDGGQVAADDFGVGEFGAAVEIFFWKQSDTHACGYTSAASARAGLESTARTQSPIFPPCSRASSPPAKCAQFLGRWAAAPFVRRVWSGGSGEGRRYCPKRFEGRLKRFCRLSDCVGHECLSRVLDF